jgi:hypothetical protein
MACTAKESTSTVGPTDPWREPASTQNSSAPQDMTRKIGSRKNRIRMASVAARTSFERALRTGRIFLPHPLRLDNAVRGRLSRVLTAEMA